MTCRLANQLQSGADILATMELGCGGRHRGLALPSPPATISRTPLPGGRAPSPWACTPGVNILSNGKAAGDAGRHGGGFVDPGRALAGEKHALLAWLISYG